MYTDIIEAIENANKGDTLLILDDIMLDREIVIDETKDIEIDLNGKIISSTSENTINNTISILFMNIF